MAYKGILGAVAGDIIVSRWFYNDNSCRYGFIAM